MIKRIFCVNNIKCDLSNDIMTCYWQTHLVLLAACFFVMLFVIIVFIVTKSISLVNRKMIFHYYKSYIIIWLTSERQCNF